MEQHGNITRISDLEWRFGGEDSNGGDDELLPRSATLAQRAGARMNLAAGAPEPSPALSEQPVNCLKNRPASTQHALMFPQSAYSA